MRVGDGEHRVERGDARQARAVLIAELELQRHGQRLEDVRLATRGRGNEFNVVTTSLRRIVRNITKLQFFFKKIIATVAVIETRDEQKFRSF